MAPPLPPPGVPDRAGAAPEPIAWLWVMTLLSPTRDRPLLLSAPPVEQAPPRNGCLGRHTERLPRCAIIPPPSRTTRLLVLRTSAVASMVIVTGRGPQEKVITPPAATAATTACEVQPAGVPSPMTWSGWLVLTGCPAGGTSAWRAGLP